MSSGETRIGHLGDVTFQGQVGKQIARYAREAQQLARDLAVEADLRAMEAEKAMGRLKGHPALLSVDVRIRAILVTRPLRRARDAAQGMAAESVKFALQYRREFMEVDDSGRSSTTTSAKSSTPWTGRVDL